MLAARTKFKKQKRAAEKAAPFAVIVDNRQEPITPVYGCSVAGGAGGGVDSLSVLWETGGCPKLLVSRFSEELPLTELVSALSVADAPALVLFVSMLAGSTLAALSVPVWLLADVP